MLFFNADGDPQRCRDNIAEMLANVEQCLDLARLRSTTIVRAPRAHRAAAMTVSA